MRDIPGYNTMTAGMITVTPAPLQDCMAEALRIIQLRKWAIEMAVNARTKYTITVANEQGLSLIDEAEAILAFVLEEGAG